MFDINTDDNFVKLLLKN